MEERSSALLQEMQIPAFNLQRFLKQHENQFASTNPSEIWQKAVKESGLTKSAIIRESGISYAFFYDILNGKKTPSRDKVLRLIFAMQLSLPSCQNLLLSLQLVPLQPENRRDLILLYALMHKYSVDRVSCLLEDCFEAPLK